MNNILKSHLRLWLILGLMAAALLTLAFQGGDTDPAHCGHCQPPTPTPTDTPTSLPPQACQVAAVEFDKAEYLTGDPIKVTLRISDSLGAPLIGANVDATVSRQPFTDTLEASAIPPLEDQSGTYDGIYTQTDLPGIYTFKFDVSDFTGPRFLPCSAEATVRVEPPNLKCEVYDVTPPEGTEVNRNNPITLTARVRLINGPEQCNANVSALVTKPGGSSGGQHDFTGACPYTLVYTDTAITDTYTFDISATSPDGSFEACGPVQRKIKVVDNPQPPCSITLQAAPNPAILNQTINLTATVTNANGVTPVATATVQIPNNGPRQIPLTCTNTGLCTGSYTPTVTGTHTFEATATDPASGQNFVPCRSQPPIVVPVNDQPPTPTLIIDLPPQPIELCGRPNPDITGTIAISNVTNLTAVRLEVSYSPSFIQVIDAFRRPRPPVQVKPDPNFDPFLNNGVDVRQGKIFFTANAQSPVTGRGNVIYVDWRLQGRTGVTPVTVAAVITDASGTQNVTQTKSLQIIINDTCVQGTVNLQGRADHSGVMVNAPSGQQTQSYPSGLFTIPSADPLSFVFPGYLAAQLNAPEGQAANQNNITLLAGDVNGDSVINILDMTYLAGRYLSTNSTADLNGDGTVNILDLTLVAGNYQRRGPLTTWQ